MHVTASTHRLKPVARPFVPRTTTELLRGRYDTPGEERAKRLLAAVAPTADKIRRRNRAALKAAIAILEVAPVELHAVQATVDALPDTPHLAWVRVGCVTDSHLWEDARNVMKLELQGHAVAGSDALLGTCLAVIDALLSVPEHVRWAAVAEREAA